MSHFLRCILAVVLVVALLTMGGAAAAICPFDTETPTEFTPDDGMTGTVFQNELAGMCTGSLISLNALTWSSSAGIAGTNSYQSQAVASGGEIQYALSLKSGFAPIKTEITAQRALSYTPVSGGLMQAGESTFADLAMANTTITNTTNPFCEGLTAGSNAVMSSGAIASQSFTGITLSESGMPLSSTYNVAMGGPSGEGFADGQGSVFARGYTIQYPGIRESDSTFTQFAGSFQFADQFTYTSEHGEGVFRLAEFTGDVLPCI